MNPRLQAILDKANAAGRLNTTRGEAYVAAEIEAQK